LHSRSRLCLRTCTGSCSAANLRPKPRTQSPTPRPGSRTKPPPPRAPQNHVSDLLAMMAFLRVSPLDDRGFFRRLIVRPLKANDERGLMRLQARTGARARLLRACAAGCERRPRGFGIARTARG
jgi:hypothetical protein